MSDEDAIWWERRQFLLPEKMQALGYMNLVWTNCEYWLQEIFAEALGKGPKIGRIISHDLGDITIWEKTRLLSKIRNDKHDVQDALEHASKMYDRCRANRNQFTHVSLSGQPTLDGSAIRLTRSKGPELFGPPLTDSLADVKRVCEEIEACKAYLASICMIMGFRRLHELGEEWKEPPPPLPEKPPLPEFVFQPPARKTSKPQRPPLPSQE